jgi:hypothetical protein
MLTKLRTHAPLAVAGLALFFAIGGPSFAAGAVKSAAHLITGKQIKNNSITTKDVKNGSLLKQDFKGGQLPVGPRGLQGVQGTAGTDGRDGAPGPSDIYAAGKADQTLTGTETEVASLTVPPGSYLIGAKSWAGKNDTTIANVNCELGESATGTTWDFARVVLPSGDSSAVMALGGADTFTTSKDVKLFCSTDNQDVGAIPAVNLANTRLWATKTGALHATLPLPND